MGLSGYVVIGSAVVGLLVGLTGAGAVLLVAAGYWLAWMRPARAAARRPGG